MAVTLEDMVEIVGASVRPSEIRPGVFLRSVFLHSVFLRSVFLRTACVGSVEGKGARLLLMLISLPPSFKEACSKDIIAK